MEPDIILRPKTLHGLVQGLSGLFVSKTSTGLTPKELKMLSVLVFVCRERNTREVTKDVKQAVSEITNHSSQVVTNYVGKFKQKGAVSATNIVNHVLFGNKIAIIYE
jgi:hypothetical protein